MCPVSTCPSESASEAGGSARRRGVTVSQTPAMVTARASNPFLCPGQLPYR